uniref:ABC transporter substrate-binding protein n=1 Tax=Aliarcobacter sp. TaxID=2321116 RepID=UPI0040484195
MFIKKLLFITLLLVINLHAQENNKLTLHLDWLNQFQFAGYYIAKEKGYYNEFGLDVDIKEFTVNYDIVNKVMSDKNSYGIGKSSLIIEKFEGNDLVLLSAIFQNSPLVLISLKSSNIKTPKDLKNKKIMITNDAKNSASITSMIVSQGISIEDIEIQKHSFNLEDLITGKTDAMASYLSNEPYLLKKRDIEFNIINPKDYNFDFYEGILFTSKDEINNNPNRAENFTRASLKGWDYAFNNIEETANLIYQKYNTQNKSLDSLIYEGKILKKLSKIDENLLGYINPQTIDEVKRFYSLLGLNNKNNNFDRNTILFNNKNVLLNNTQIEYLRNNHFSLLVKDKQIPFSFKMANTMKGIEIDFWNLISNKLSKPFSIEETISDGIFNIFSDTVKAKYIYSFKKVKNDKYLVSDSIAQIPIVITTKNDKNFIPNLKVLKNIKIGVLKNLDLIETLKDEYPKINFIEIQNIDEGIDKLNKNNIFAYIDNIYTVSHIIETQQLSNLKINTTLEHKLNIYLQVENKDAKFLEIINNVINKLSEEERNIILNNYQLILYQKNIDFLYVAKFIFPLLFLLGIFVFFNFRLKNEIKKRKTIEIQLSNLANKDSLTNIYNRRKIEELCEKEIDRSNRYNNDLSIIFFDVNDFKVINDLLGHHIGDDVLVKIAQIVSKNIRSTDYLGRWGGDEFLIILPETNISKTKNLITILENKLKDIKFNLDKKINISCSFGYSEYEKGDDLDLLLRKADESMYFVKSEHKKNKI